MNDAEIPEDIAERVRGELRKSRQRRNSPMLNSIAPLKHARRNAEKANYKLVP